MYKETDLISKTRLYATEKLQKELPKACTYHNYNHTQSVVNVFIEIGQASNLSDEEMEAGIIAAWCHDIGYSVSGKDHEANSVKLTTEFLSGAHAATGLIEQVAKIIMATRMPQKPASLVEKIICDADLHHLGTADYRKMSEALRQETESLGGQSLPANYWERNTFFFFSEHRYFTEYAQEKYGPVKEKNAAELRKKVKELNKLDKKIKKLEEQLGKTSKKLVLKPDRGIETMFRTTSRNHLALSSIADNKANIMISVNTILISIIIASVFRRLPEYPNLLVPVVALIFVCLITIVLSILATRPHITSGTFTKDDIMNKKTNLLFFGNFHSMSQEDYEWGVREMMQDADYLYGSLTKDIYFLGKVLGKKYRLLRYAYTTFMIGFVVCILLFVLAVMLPADAFYQL
jgi:predicted metal-dependent HD superfamily phosphohydrolase